MKAIMLGKKRSYWFTIGFILIISILGVLIILYCTRWGPWVTSDATMYIVSARNFLAGRGFGIYRPSGRFLPLSIIPPMFPLTLSAIGTLGIDLTIAAKWLNSILFGLTLLVTATSIYNLTRWTWFSITWSLFFLIQPELIGIFSGAMSEPLFFFAGFSGLFLLIYYMKLNRRIMLIGAAITTGVAFFTRYVGSAFLIAGALGLLLFQQGNLKKRITDTIYYCGIGSLPMITWLGWLYSQPQMEPPRQFHFVIEEIPSRLITLRLYIVDKIWNWIPYSTAIPALHYRTKLFIILLFLTIMIILIFIGAKNFKNVNNKKWFRHVGFLLTSQFGFVITIYIAILAITYSLTSPWSLIHHQRLMTPVYIVGIMMIFSALFFLSETTITGHWVQLISVIVVIVIIASSLPRSIELIEKFHSEGGGFTSVSSRSSETIKRLNDLPSEIILISNQEEAILYYTNRPAYDIPELRNKKPLSDFHRFGDDKDDNVQTIFREQNAALVLFDNVYWEFVAIYGESAQQRLDAFTEGLYLYRDYQDGAIYFYTSKED
jgi:hypothetical protein